MIRGSFFAGGGWPLPGPHKGSLSNGATRRVRRHVLSQVSFTRHTSEATRSDEERNILSCLHFARLSLGPRRRPGVPPRDRPAVRPQRASWESLEVVEDEVAVVIEREVALLTREVRSSADQLEELLDPDFEEIGKSGHLWTRGEMIAALVAGTDPEEPRIKVSDMSGRTVGPGIVLLTYDTQLEGRRAPQLSMGPVDEGVAGPAPPGHPHCVADPAPNMDHAHHGIECRIRALSQWGRDRKTLNGNPSQGASRTGVIRSRRTALRITDFTIG